MRNFASILAGTLIAVLALSSDAAFGQGGYSGELGIEQDEVTLGKKDYSPYLHRAYPDQVLWGDTHLHTSYSTDAGMVGNLLGIKISLNELVAYGVLGSYIQEGAMSDRGAIISTYALCGFANFSSLAIQIGGIGAMAPERRSDLARLGVKAMFAGAFASWLTACVVGMLWQG